MLHVQTERKTLEDKQIQPIHPVDPFPIFGSKPSPPVWGAESGLPSLSLSAPTPSDTLPPGPSSSTSPTGRVPWQLNTNTSSPAPGAPGSGPGPAPATPPSNSQSSEDSQKAKHPGPISLPPFPSLGEMHALSPLQTRGLPPMTPSMPGFVFNAYPSTPPAMPQFHAPGAGPFSPGLPVTSPIYNHQPPFLNAAPGAPVTVRGSAALSTPTTQAFPPNAPHSAAGPPGAEIQNQREYFPRLDPDQAIEEVLGSTAGLSLAGGGGGGGSVGRDTPTKKPGNGRKDRGGKKGAPGNTSTSTGTNANATSSANGRNSLDDARGPGGAWNMDRRASWSEVAAGTK